MFLLYPALRPWHDESTADGARASMASGYWVASHLFAMIGLIAVPLGLWALHAVVRATPGERLAVAAAVTGWIGAGLTLPYYGAEDFGLHAIASTPGSGDLLRLAEAVRYEPVAVTTFGIGLVALGVAAVLAALAVRRSGMLPAVSGLLFAAGFVVFLPQFYLPPAARIAHGVLLAAGCLHLAVELGRRRVASDSLVM
jgi:hypothetical protein